MTSTSFEALQWKNIAGIASRQFVCGTCNSDIASERGWEGTIPGTGQTIAYIYVCHQCSRPSFFDRNGEQTPGAMFGEPVLDIPDQSVASLYEEARRCFAANGYTAVVLCCRKLLMHLAVAKGAKAGETFVSYVEYLANKNYVPPDAREWVDQIRARGNEANHQIVIMQRTDGEELISFCEMLLKIIYQFPAAVRKRASGVPPGNP